MLIANTIILSDSPPCRRTAAMNELVCCRHARLSNVDPNTLFLRNFAHNGKAHFASVAAALVAAIGRHRTHRAPGIDPDIAGLEGLRRPHRTPDVTSDHGGR